MYILTSDIGDTTHEEFAEKWAAYEAYLHSLYGLLPDQAYEFALAKWHYNPGYHECPHDAWVKSIVIEEVGTGDRSEIRAYNILVTLLGAYHDGEIFIKYENVKKYSSSCQGTKHGDWLVDEVRLSSNGLVVHEIEFDQAHWQIECEDIVFSWLAFDIHS